MVPEPEPATDHHDKPSEETTHITHSDQDLPTALATPTEVDQMVTSVPSDHSIKVIVVTVLGVRYHRNVLV